VFPLGGCWTGGGFGGIARVYKVSKRHARGQTYRVLFIFDLLRSRHLVREARDVAVEVVLVVDLRDDVAHATPLVLSVAQRADDQAVAKKKPFVERG
jgi:hypothetical protein